MPLFQLKRVDIVLTPAPKSDLHAAARTSGDPFAESIYYEDAEAAIDWQWEHVVQPMLDRLPIDYSSVMDFAAGHGRNSVHLQDRAQRIYIVDINQSCIDHCILRFRGDRKFKFLKNDGVSLAGVTSDSVSFLFTFDSMVHFDSDVVRAYLKEFRRVLQPDKLGFCHHSNYTANPGGDFKENPHWRNFMSKELFAHGCAKEGLEVVEQHVTDWGTAPHERALDCITIFRKPR